MNLAFAQAAPTGCFDAIAKKHYFLLSKDCLLFHMTQLISRNNSKSHSAIRKPNGGEL